jgi:hypothetical protein
MSKIMTLKETVELMLKQVEQEHGPEAPFAQSLRRQLEEIEQWSTSPDATSGLMHYSAGFRGGKSVIEPMSADDFLEYKVDPNEYRD